MLYEPGGPYQPIVLGSMVLYHILLAYTIEYYIRPSQNTLCYSVRLYNPPGASPHQEEAAVHGGIQLGEAPPGPALAFGARAVLLKGCRAPLKGDCIGIILELLLKSYYAYKGIEGSFTEGLQGSYYGY